MLSFNVREYILEKRVMFMLLAKRRMALPSPWCLRDNLVINLPVDNSKTQKRSNRSTAAT